MGFHLDHPKTVLGVGGFVGGREQARILTKEREQVNSVGLKEGELSAVTFRVDISSKQANEEHGRSESLEDKSTSRSSSPPSLHHLRKRKNLPSSSRASR